jgi:hypothetical protein
MPLVFHIPMILNVWGAVRSFKITLNAADIAVKALIKLGLKVLNVSTCVINQFN